MIIDNNNLIFDCPHCKLQILVHIDDIRCGIFRHAVMKNGYQAVNPHLSEADCQRMILFDLVYGCCLPFQIIRNGDGHQAVKCGYI